MGTVKRKIYVGTSGWSYADWAGVVYPSGGRGGELEYLSRFVDAVEVNTSFYRPPSARMCEGWLKKVRGKPDFMFTAKLWQRFTHERNTIWSAGEAARFKEGMAPLQEAGKLGALLIQFPWSFAADEGNFEWLGRVAETFEEYPGVVEVRHASWNAPEAHAFLRERGLNFCNIDQPRSSRGIGRTNMATGPIAYYRFHGRNREAWFRKDAGRDERYNYLYTERELAPWMSDIASMAAQVEQVFVMNNNHYRGQAVVNALQVKAQLSEAKVLVPEVLAERYPVLASIALPPRGQQSLPFGG